MKILIVEDNADDRRLLRLNLEHHGCEVVEAADGQEGLEMAKTHKPDVIISDALMPKMDGFQFLRAVKTDKILKDIPFIFYSAVYTGYKEAELAISLGAEAFVIKPKEPKEFWDELHAILEERKLRKPNALYAELIEEEEEFLKKYSQIVATKLEEKVRELEKAKARVEEKEQEWQMTFDSIGDCVTIHDMDFNVLLANKSCERVLGASQSEIRSRKCFELFHGRNEPHDACPKLNTEQTGKPFETEMFEPKLNLYLSITCFPLLDKNGAVLGVVHIAKDITGRNKIEEALKENEARFRATFEQAAVGIAHVAPDGRWLRVNQKLCDIVGYSREELLTKTFQDITYPDDLKTDLNYVRQVLADEIKTYSMDKRYILKDGTIVWIRLTVSLVRDDNGGPKYFISVIENITDQKKLEEQLRQSQKMESIGTLAGGIAHDFNNILTATIGYASVMKMKMPEDDPLKHNLEQILSSSERAAVLTQSLLAFSRKQLSNPEPVNLSEIIRKAEKFLSRVIGEDIELKMTLSDNGLTVMADSGQIEQVLMNLTTNARDAMPKGGVLTIQTEPVEFDSEFMKVLGYGEAGRYACLIISDSGIGMDEATKERIYEPFFTTKGVGKGTGLGLSMVYGIIKQHNGYINCYSEPGKGTTFKIYLPLFESMPASKTVTEGAAAAVPAHGTETILLAEDEESVRRLMKAVLEADGYKVIEAADGEEAINKFMENKDRIDILLLDIVMPKISGREVYERIKKIKPDIKLLMASGYPADFISQRGILEEGVNFIAKPMSPTKFLKKVREVLDSTPYM